MTTTTQWVLLLLLHNINRHNFLFSLMFINHSTFRKRRTPLKITKIFKKHKNRKVTCFLQIDCLHTTLPSIYRILQFFFFYNCLYMLSETMAPKLWQTRLSKLFQLLEKIVFLQSHSMLKHQMISHIHAKL